MIVLNASVLVGYLDGDDLHHEEAEAPLSRAVDGDLAVDLLTLAEVLVVPVRQGRLDAVLTALSDLDIETLPFHADIAVRLAVLRASSGLRMPDCCVLLAAADAQAAVATFDDRLARATADRGLPVLAR